MPRGHRLAPALGGAALTGLLAGCTPYYTSSSPPTGEGRQLALVFLVVLLVPTLLLAALLAWYHLHDRGDGPRRPPGTVAVAGAWCFLAAALVAWPAGWVLWIFLRMATGAIRSLGEERLFLDYGWMLVVLGVASLGAAMMVVTLGLSVLRGQQWARVVTIVLSALAFAGGLLGTATTGGSTGDGILVSLLLVALGPVPIPFLIWWDAEEVFARRSPAPPIPAAPTASRDEPEPAPEERSLTDRWHRRG
jgi:hypothetical protein